MGYYATTESGPRTREEVQVTMVAKCLIFGPSTLDGGYQQGSAVWLVLGMKAGGSGDPR